MASETLNSNTKGVWETYCGLDREKLKAKLSQIRQDGYRLTNLTGFNDNGFERYLIICEKETSTEWEASYASSKEEFLAVNEDFKSKGYHIVQVCGYATKHIANFSAIWEKRTGPDVATEVDMTSDRLQEAVDEFTNKGYVMVYLNAYVVEDVEHFAAIWEKRDSLSEIISNCYPIKLRRLCRDYFNEGYCLKTVCGYNIANTDAYAALFEKTPTSKAMSVNWGYSYEEYLEEVAAVIKHGLKLTYVHPFASGSTVKFCAMWHES